MQIVGNSSIWVEKYRPKTISDLIIPKEIRSLFNKFVEENTIRNIIMYSSPGHGKTASAYALCNDLNAEVLYVNGSLDGIDNIRYNVTQFAMTSSFSDGGKIVIFDEIDNPRMIAAQDALKSLMEQTEANCRYILTANHISRVIEPLQSRCQDICFNFPQKDTKDLIIAYFKRVCWILDQEKIKYDKKVLAEFITKQYPDFRKILNRLQKAIDIYGEVNSDIFIVADETTFNNIIKEMKDKKFNNVRKICSTLEPEQFYSTFYSQIDSMLIDECKPNVVITLGKYAYETQIAVPKEISLMACLTELMRECKWK